MNTSDIFLGIIAIFFPPLAVWIKRGVCSADSLVNILLCIFGLIPGLLHAWYIIAEYPENGSKLPQLESGDLVVPGQIRGANSWTQVPNLSNQIHVGYGTTNTVAHLEHHVVDGTSNINQLEPNEGSEYPSMPPTYMEAIKGDHKIQTIN